MALYIFNTLTRKKEKFVPRVSGKVGFYACGPTVYNYVHLGNLRAYMFFDLLRRYLKYKGYEVFHVMNITDVDDKTIRDSQKEGKTLKEFTEFYTEAFLSDLKLLNIELPEAMPKATECVPEMVKIMERLEENGLLYKSEDGSVYFPIQKFEGYGKLANIDVNSLKENASGRLSQDEYGKDNVQDFALWKAWSEEDGENKWETPYGPGRPGWHIECSAMSWKHLGESFDIHAGGVDLVFPHHTNEIAQSEGAFKKKFVNYWMHNAHLIVNGQKMSKSLGNFYVLSDLIGKGYHPMAIRYELLGTHYRQQLDFREENLGHLTDTLQKFYDFLDKLSEIKKSDDGAVREDHPEVIQLVKHAKEAFEEGMDDDLNISKGLAAVFNFMNSVNKIMGELSVTDADLVVSTMEQFDSVLGVMRHEKGSLDADIDALVKEREEARGAKNWARADEIRDVLAEKGIILEDTPTGVRWKRKV